MYFDDKEGVFDAAEFGLGNLIPWYGEMVKKREQKSKQKLKREMEVVDGFDDALAKEMAKLGL